VKADPIRIRRYLASIRKNSIELNSLIDNNHLAPESLELKAAKYLLIEIAEAMSNTIQHILAKDRGLAVSGYIDAILKAYENGLIDEALFGRLKPFFDFRNSLVHRYWTIDDTQLVENLVRGRYDFDRFIEAVESWMN